MIRVLFLGDIVGRAARHEVIEQVPALRKAGTCSITS